MWEELARTAAADAGQPGALAGLDSLQVVFCQSWEYDDPCARLADRLGASPRTSAYSGLGGSVPVRLAAEAAGSMARGQLDLALIVGGEALATRRHLAQPDWSHPPAEPRPYPISIDRQERKNGIFQAYLTFALLDTARRAHRGQSVDDRRHELGRLMAPMSEIAAAQPEHAWFPTARTPEEISTATPDNRMVATPYTKLMTAIMDVDMGAAVLLATESRADSLGVPPDRRIYLHGTGTADEPSTMAARPEPWQSPAMATALRAALGQTSVDEVGHLDLYSCFASSLSFAGDALGLAPGRALTVTGGLPYHGGPGSNYCTHALAAMTETLRADPGAHGLVSGIGMHMTSHAASLWSSRPGPYRPPEPAPALPTVPVASDASGPATVVSFSTVYNRQGPEWTALICDLPDGSRTYARLEDPAPAETDLTGLSVTVSPTDKGATTARL
jgi:acetyl-CoA C-acetyltransferase